MMEIPVIKIGNSKGIRLSKVLLERYKIKDKVDLQFEQDCIILKPKKQPREGWEKAFKQMHENRDDKLLSDNGFEEETFEKWK